MHQIVCVKNRENKYYYIVGTEILHREDGPAVIYKDGRKEWYMNGKLHRVGGPAVETEHGGKFWIFYDKIHRVDGPAVITKDGELSWYLNDIYFKTKEAWFEALTESQKEKALYSDYFIGG
jgi:hypothetical protein